MVIRIWSNEYSSGIENIDLQHMNLFGAINSFEEDYDESLSNPDAAAFLEKIAKQFHDHFDSEEELMEEYDYPLMDVHKADHEDMRLAFSQCLYSFQNPKPISRMNRQRVPQDKPYLQILDLTTRWLNHMVRDDLIIFHYIKHRDFNLGTAIFGRTCEILTMDNQLIGYGKIALVEDEDIEINCRHGHVPVKFNDVVKVSVIMQNQEACHFVSKVFLNKNTSLTLFKSAVIKTMNERAFYRISVVIDAILRANGREPSKMRIIDISAGGMLIETEEVLRLGEEIVVEFVLEKTWFTENCEIIRLFKKDFDLHHYGIKFAFMEGEVLTNLVGQLHFLQAKRNQNYKDRD